MKHIPNNVKIALFCLVSTLLGIFLISTAIVHASNLPLEQTSENSELPYSILYNYPLAQTFNCDDVVGKIVAVTLKGSANGTPDMQTQLVLNIGGIISTSTLGYIPAYYTPNAYRETTFFFTTSVECLTGNATMTPVRVSGNELSYFRFTTTNAYASGTLVSTEGTGDLFFKIYTDTECETVTENTCDMASTTEAIYTVGYSTNLILGIFLCLLFSYIGFKFIKLFI